MTSKYDHHFEWTQGGRDRWRCSKCLKTVTGMEKERIKQKHRVMKKLREACPGAWREKRDD